MYLCSCAIYDLTVVVDFQSPLYSYTMSDSSEISSEDSFVSDSEEESDEMEATVGINAPHQDEPLADTDDKNESEDTDDPDMLAPATLARKENQNPVEAW